MRRHVNFLVLFSLACAPTLTLAQDWEAQLPPTSNLLQSVWFTTAERGFVAGDVGTLLQTEDGGQSWTPILLTTADLQGLAFRGEALGLIVGDNGGIFRTVNGGDDWVQLPAVTTSNLTGVAFGAGELVFAAGRDGVILRSLDDGASWSVLETGTDRYRGLSAHGLRAWAVGNDGVIRATTDGGQSWSSLPSGTIEDLHEVIFIGDDEGWIAGQNNLLLYSDDGGQSWSSRNNSIGVGLNAVFFGNAELGWCGGSLGNAYHSTDAGVIWNNEPTPTANDLEDLYFFDAFRGWAVGDNGTILERRVPSVDITLGDALIEWTPLVGPFDYDVVRGDLTTIGAGVGGSVLGCHAENVLGASVTHGVDPGPGEAWWFAVRVVENGSNVTYDSGSFLQRGLRDPAVAASGLDCLE